jgi:hypothetical protein
MVRVARWSAAAALLLSLTVVVDSATASGGSRAALRLSFTSMQPGTSTGLRVDARFGDPVGSSNKPPRLVSAVITLPAGWRIATGSRPQCTASDAELQVAGTLACPDDTVVGSGAVTAVTGLGAPVDPLVGDDTVINGKDELIEVVTPPGAPAPPAGVDRLTVSGHTLTAHPPNVPGGPPDGSTNIQRILFFVPAHGSSAHPYMTTPPRCPSSGHWTTTAAFTFADGHTTTTTATTPCRRRR